MSSKSKSELKREDAQAKNAEAKKAAPAKPVSKPSEPAKKAEPKKSAAKPKVKKEVKLIPCETCQATGLVLPGGDIKFKSQATETCKECSGTGSVEE